MITAWANVVKVCGVSHVHMPIHLVVSEQMAIGRLSAAFVLNLYAMDEEAFHSYRGSRQIICPVFRKVAQRRPINGHISIIIGNVCAVLVAIEILALSISSITCWPADR